MLSNDSRRIAGILLVVFPTVIYGGVMLMFLIDPESGYMSNSLRQNLFRAGHAHAGVLLILSLVVLLYVDEVRLSAGWKQFVRSASLRLRFCFHWDSFFPCCPQPRPRPTA
jgi:hypothetical protein